MRKIEKQMQNAIRNRENWASSNTTVSVDEEGYTSIRLLGHRLGEIEPNGDMILSSCGWSTVTTKSRLNAILDVFLDGMSIFQKDFTWYIGKDQFFDGYRITR